MSSHPRRAVIRAAAFAGLSLLPSAASAHDVGLSSSDFAVESDGWVRATVVFSQGEAARLASIGTGGEIDVAGGARAFDRDAFVRRVSEGIVVRADGQACERASAQASDDAATPFGVALAFRCKPPRDRVDVELLFVGDLSPDAHHLLQVREGAVSVSTIVSGTNRAASLDVPGAGSARGRPRGLARELAGAVKMGVEHILTGWDHLLFLAALILGTATVRALVGTISAFTVAHSATLALAALGLVAPSARWIEPAIAASIVCVAAENLLRRKPARRWPIAFAFGLVHGFGFAGALRELALDRARLLPALVGFNAGVEIGQLAVLAVAVPVLAALRKNTRFEEKWNWTASASIGAIGAALLVTRLWGP